jgi:hypothetical protein
VFWEVVMRLLLLLVLTLALGACGHLHGITPSGRSCPNSHPIKGNADSMLYHLPGTPYYYDTIPERCFSTEHDAKLSGFRKAGP